MSAHLAEDLSAYLDGELAPAERQAVESHLRGCDQCARRLVDFAALDALAHDLPVEAPPGYFDALPGRVRFKVTPRRRGVPRLPAWSWAVAAALVVAVVTPILLRQNPRPAEVGRSASPVAAPAAERADRAEPGAAAKALPTPAAGPVPEGEERAFSSRDERVARREAVEALPPPARPAAAPAAPPAARVPTAAPAGGSALGTLARNEAPAPLGLAKEATAKDKLQEALPTSAPAAAPAERAQGTSSASATFAAPPEQGAAGQHLYEPKAESDLADAASGSAEAKKTRSAPKPAVTLQDAERAETAAPPAPRLRFRTLAAVAPETAEAARRLREQWRAFVAQDPAARQADEARVRMIEAGAAAWRLSNSPADLVVAKRDAEAYLRREDAAQGVRVRAVLATLGS